MQHEQKHTNLLKLDEKTIFSQKKFIAKKTNNWHTICSANNGNVSLAMTTKKMNESFIYSIGHGNKSIEDFISALHKFGIKYLIDVRSVPYSKFNPAFNQASLKKAINATGDIRYLYMGDVLGGLPKNDALKTEGKMDYSKMKAVPDFIKGIDRLVHANELKIPICVMCSESEPSHCHRSKLIGESLKERGVNIQHIVKSKLRNQREIYVIKSQNYVMNEVNPNGSVDLFGNETTLTSVKTY